MRAWLIPFLVPLLLLPVAQAQPTGWIQLDNKIDEAAGDGPPRADMVDLFFGANTTHAFFRQNLADTPLVLAISYTVTLDYPRGGAFNPDYRLVHTVLGSYLHRWNGTNWIYVEDIVVTADAANDTVIFEVPFASIGGSLDAHMDVWFENYLGPPFLDIPVDRAPDGDRRYKIHKKVIPNLPGFVLLAFAGVLVATVLVLRRRYLPP